MKILPSISKIQDQAKVMLRMDLDLPDGDNSRLVKSVDTIAELIAKDCKIIILGHLGRPSAPEEKYSLRPVYAELMALIDEKIGTPISSVFVEDIAKIETVDAAVDGAQIVFLENVRFFEGERNNDPGFLQYLSSLAEVYVQEAFAVAHRTSPSMMVGSILPCYFGNSFIKEYQALENIVENPKKPVVVILGGAKADKLDHIETLQYIADEILLVGTLPREVNFAKINQKVQIGILRADGMDIDQNTILKFSEIVKNAGTVIWAGSAGKWEDPECEMGTKSLLEAMANSGAFSVIAGGDTTSACRRFGYADKVGLISSGGGVMMEFLAKKCLPVVESARMI